MYLTYSSRMMECHRDGYEEGLQQGAYQKALETARNLLSMGLSPEQVAQGTSLPLETVFELVQEK